MAPAWRTHRRALAEVGESRRAREWTLAAVAAAREGIEMGLEERQRPPSGGLPEPDEADGTHGRGGPDATDDPGSAPERPMPLVAGPLPILDDENEAGRLLPRDAATERDIRDQLGLLSDAEVDILLVEVLPGSAMAHVAIEAVAGTGLPVWAAAVPAGWETSGAALEGWADEAVAAGAERLLTGIPRRREHRAGPGAGSQADEEAIERVATILARAARHGWGGLLEPPAGAPADTPSGGRVDPVGGAPESVEALATARGWLAAGARALGVLSGADPASLAPARSAVDEAEGAERARRSAVEGRWREALTTAARMAPGGAALWLGDPEPAWLPTGFEWQALSATLARQLPAGRYRLIVEAEPAADLAGQLAPSPGRSASLGELATLLDEGGVLARSLADGSDEGDPRLRLVRVDDGVEPALGIWRRET